MIVILNCLECYDIISLIDNTLNHLYESSHGAKKLKGNSLKLLASNHQYLDLQLILFFNLYLHLFFYLIQDNLYHLGVKS